jgi:hypothetical protein
MPEHDFLYPLCVGLLLGTVWGGALVFGLVVCWYARGPGDDEGEGL